MVPTLGFNLLYVLVIVRLARRELVSINVTAHPTSEWIAQQITEWSAIGTAFTALRLRADYEPWASATSPLPRARLGRIHTRRD